MDDPNQPHHQTYYSWIRDRFRLDTDALEEITSCIAMPGLSDEEMPDVLSLLADEDPTAPLELQPTFSLQQEQPSSAPAPAAAQPGTAGDQQRTRVSLELAAISAVQHQAQQQQQQQQAQMQVQQQPLLQGHQLAPQQLQLQQKAFLFPKSEHFVNNTAVDFEQQPGVQQPCLQQQVPQQQIYQQLQQQPLQTGCFLAAQQYSNTAAFPGIADVSAVAAPYFADEAELTAAVPRAASVATAPGSTAAAGPAAATPFKLHVSQLPLLAAGTVAAHSQQAAAAGNSPASASAPSHAVGMPAARPQPVRYSAGKSDGSASLRSSSHGSDSGAAPAHAAAPAAAAAAAAVAGVMKRRRKPSEAQRQAHRRFRQRRKQQMVELESEVTAKQAQLQALALEHAALSAKARALDQLVTSAGESYSLVQNMQQLSVSQEQGQQHQPQAPEAAAAPQQAGEACQPSAASGSSGESAGSSNAAADAAGVQQQEQQQCGVAGTDSARQQSPTSSSKQHEPRCGSLEAMQQALELGMGWDGDQQQLLQQFINSGQSAAQESMQQLGPLQPQLQQPQAPADSTAVRRSGSSSGSGSGLAGEGSVEHFGAALTRMVSPSNRLPADPVQLLPAGERQRLQSQLATLQAAIKSFAAEVMQLLLQISQEEGKPFRSWPAGHPLQQQLLLQQQQQTSLGQLSLLQQQQWEDGLTTAFHSSRDGAAAAAGLPAGRQTAYERLQQLVLQVQKEFRAFVMNNRIALYHLNTLNYETGVLGAPVPPGHWQKVAQLLKDRLSQEAIADMVVARQLYSCAVMRIKQQRQLLVLQLKQVLEQYSSMEQYKSDVVLSTEAGPHGQGNELLDAIDSNMRKEYTLEGVYQWTFRKLVPPMLAAELLVHSWPYLPDVHAVLDELIAAGQPVPAVAALQDMQQLRAMEQQAHVLGQWSIMPEVTLQGMPAAAPLGPSADPMPLPALQDQQQAILQQPAELWT